ncbi:MAG: PilZ domain-containing protein [Terriglobia bacterium]
MRVQGGSRQVVLARVGTDEAGRTGLRVKDQKDRAGLGLASRGERAQAVREMVAGERPRAQRFAIQTPLTYRAVGDGEWRRGTMVNISETGVLFEGEKVWGMGQVVEVRFRLSTGNGGEPAVQVVCRGKIARTENEVRDAVAKTQAARINKFRFERPAPPAGV